MMAIEFFGDVSRPSAIVIRSTESVPGIQFYSPSDYSQQLGLMTRPAGYVVPAHIHNEVERKITQTQEVLLIRNGSCLVTLFDSNYTPIEKIVLEKGDVILLANGAHKIEMISECEILEVKQGPYAGDNDKTQIQEKS
jgi:hypothetical protein